MAPSGESLKSLVARKKAEYSLRFPFLTERQILAKLRRVWESQKRSSPTECRKSFQGVKIITAKVSGTDNGKSRPHHTDKEQPSARPHQTGKEQLSARPHHTDKEQLSARPHHTDKEQLSARPHHTDKEQLSAYDDIGTDSVIPQRNAPPSKCPQNHTGRIKNLRKLSSSCKPPRKLSPQLEDETLSVMRELSHTPSSSLVETHTALQPLDQNTLAPGGSVCGPPAPTSRTSCLRDHPPGDGAARRRKEIPHRQPSTANTRPFPTREACCPSNGRQVAGKTQLPIWPRQSGDAGSRLSGKQVTTKSLTTLHSPPSPPTQDLVSRVGASSSQNCSFDNYSLVCAPVSPCPSTDKNACISSGYELREGPGATAAASLSPFLRALPSLQSATPNADKFLQRGEKARLDPLDTPADSITSFDAVSEAAVETSILSSPSKHSEHSSYGTLALSGACGTLSSVLLLNPPSHPILARRDPARTQRHKYKSSSKQPTYNSGKRVTRSAERAQSLSCAVDPIEGGGPAKKQRVSDDGGGGRGRGCWAPDPPLRGNESPCLEHEGTPRRPSLGALCGDQHEISAQVVPEEPPNSVQEGTASTPSPVDSNLICDLFQHLTPDKTTLTSSQDHTTHRSTRKRRVFRSAAEEGDSNFFSLFDNEMDIFM